MTKTSTLVQHLPPPMYCQSHASSCPNIDIPNVTFQATANGRLLQQFNLTHSTQPVPLSVELIISNADSAQTHFLSPGDCAPLIIQGSKPVLIPDALPPGTSSGVVQVDLQRDLPQLNLENAVLFVQFRVVLEGVRGGCSFALPLREPCECMCRACA